MLLALVLGSDRNERESVGLVRVSRREETKGGRKDGRQKRRECECGSGLTEVKLGSQHSRPVSPGAGEKKGGTKRKPPRPGRPDSPGSWKRKPWVADGLSQSSAARALQRIGRPRILPLVHLRTCKVPQSCPLRASDPCNRSQSSSPRDAHIRLKDFIKGASTSVAFCMTCRPTSGFAVLYGASMMRGRHRC